MHASAPACPSKPLSARYLSGCRQDPAQELSGAGSRWFGGRTDGHTRQQEKLWHNKKLQSSVPNRALRWEIPATLKGTILGVRQHVRIWRVLGFF